MTIGAPGIGLEFWNAGGSIPTITFPTTPTPPIAHGKAGFIRILGTANANSGTVVTVPVASAVRAGRNLIVWTCTHPTGAYGPTTPAYAIKLTGVADTVGSTYTLHSSGFIDNPQYVATATLAFPLVTGDVIRCTFTRSLVPGAGVTVIVAVYFGLGTFTVGAATRFGPGARHFTITARAATTGLVSLATSTWGHTPTVSITPTANFTKRIQTRYTAGRLVPSNAPELITMAFGDYVLGPSGAPRTISVTWNQTGHLGLWIWQIA